MEELNENELILYELKSHFKELSPEIIELLYRENNKDISKTIDALIENVRLTNLYENNQKNDELIDNKNIEEKDDFFLNKDENENEKEEKKVDKNEIKNEKEKEEDKEKINEDDDDVLNFLIELAPFNTKEEIHQKLIEFNFDVDKVISNLLGELEPNDSKENDNKNKINDYLNDDNFKKIKRKTKKYLNNKPKYINYDDDKVFEFLETNKNKNRIDLHGFKLSESMFIVKEKLEQMEKIVREKGGPKLLIIVTGRGNHSPGGKPILRPNILRWLKRNKYDVNEKDPGALYVLIR